MTIDTHLNGCGCGLCRGGHDNRGDAIADGRSEEFDKTVGGRRTSEDRVSESLGSRLDDLLYYL